MSTECSHFRKPWSSFHPSSVYVCVCLYKLREKYERTHTKLAGRIKPMKRGRIRGNGRGNQKKKRKNKDYTKKIQVNDYIYSWM